jgi:hypothetical protein
MPAKKAKFKINKYSSLYYDGSSQKTDKRFYLYRFFYFLGRIPFKIIILIYNG